ncbi:MAG: hypothetical protein HC886_00555 [Leptolyngbyaceae cyanobacterium SM1_1_3]|nr:hypothetical protein [Leptolyngbyaceae cyanobacterium SM1_1_3]NJN02863.1 hypothetical protein [Leptolyngbyaceae cyanobacterium RM1_1_2]NJO09104.1 hypothetical protein [Leptolyngbyaceae cyanobacterium SL_1_1]
MNIQDFEGRYREEMGEILNQLQTVVLLSSQIEARITRIGNSIQQLSQTVESFIREQKQK